MTDPPDTAVGDLAPASRRRDPFAGVRRVEPDAAADHRADLARARTRERARRAGADLLAAEERRQAVRTRRAREAEQLAQEHTGRTRRATAAARHADGRFDPATRHRQ